MKERGEKRKHMSFEASFVEQKHQNPSLEPFLVSELAFSHILHFEL